MRLLLYLMLPCQAKGAAVSDLRLPHRHLAPLLPSPDLLDVRQYDILINEIKSTPLRSPAPSSSVNSFTIHPLCRSMASWKARNDVLAREPGFANDSEPVRSSSP
jgi:hypothetical protein